MANLRQPKIYLLSLHIQTIESLYMTKLIYFYRYPHPTISNQYIYVGQTKYPKIRDKSHRLGNEHFGRRFTQRFPEVSLPPMDIGWHNPVEDPLEAKLIEIEGIFKFHTWRGYPNGMNVTLPGLEDYDNMGRVGGAIGGIIAGKKKC
jgi:hypothetical protein